MMALVSSGLLDGDLRKFIIFQHYSIKAAIMTPGNICTLPGTISRKLTQLTTLVAVLILFQPLAARAQYCIPGTTNGCSLGDQFASFNTTGGLTNISDNPGAICEGDASGYGSFSGPGLSASAPAGATVGFSITNNPTYSEGYAIWIDWNQDGVFDASEEVYASSAAITPGATGSGSFTVPSGAVIGTTTLRIRCFWANPGTVIDPCAVYGGETYGMSFDFPFAVVPPLSYLYGSEQTAAVCHDAGPVSLDPALTVSDTTGGLTLNWSVTSGPSNGLVSGLPATTTSTGLPVLTSGVVYTPNAGFIGVDSVTVQVSDGYITTTTTININVIGPDMIGGATTVCTGQTATLTDDTTGGTWTSSDGTLATVDPSSGVVYGVAAGTPMITYASASGCSVAATVTVNSSPDAISGTMQVCTGLTTSLTDDTTGGTWMSSDNSLATVDGSGTVGGVSAGMPTITYTAPSGCSITTVVTVNTFPDAISGSAQVCTGVTAPFTDDIPGGTWSSTDNTLATVDPSTGIVSGVATGTPTIMYTIGGSCIVAVIVTVNTSPTAIGGSAQVCTGITNALSNGVAGGTWSSSNTALATVDSMSGMVTGVLAGTATIVYILPTSCAISEVVTVNTTPDAITGTLSVCQGLTTPLGDGTAGGAWISSSGSVATVNPSGRVTGLAPGFVTITYTMLSGCFSSASFTVNALPTGYLMTGGGDYCAGSPTSIPVGLSGSDFGVNYQLYRGASPVGSPLAGDGSPLDFGSFVTTGSYDVVATDTTTGCTSSMVTSVAIGVNPTPAVYIAFGGGGYCSGGAGFNIGLTGSQAGVHYQLYNGGGAVGGAISGTGAVIHFGYETTAGTYVVIATDATTGCTSTMLDSPAIVVYDLPVMYSLSGSGSYCSGAAGRHIDISGSNIGISYQLYNASGIVGGSILGIGSSMDLGIYPAGTYKLTALDMVTGCADTMSGSVAISANPLPAHFAVTGGGAYCVSGTGVDVGLGGSESGVSYQLYNGTVAVGGGMPGSGGSIDFGLQTGTGFYSVFAVNTGTGCGDVMTDSVIVSTNPLPNVYLLTSAPNATYCTGDLGIDIGITGSVVGTSYQVYNGSAATGGAVFGTGSPIDMGLQTSGGTYTVVATDTATTCESTMSGTTEHICKPGDNTKCNYNRWSCTSGCWQRRDPCRISVQRRHICQLPVVY